ncbi:NADP-dependent oxidoreductase [Leucobacter tardus]|uniref:NADP-dependent oxidoreductase n=1 Tax=Leucobacter tardus TaxID=501483 RepID=A0A939QJS1_9MICO|nr:NADP-dependent oxidoreductase [Leucobacter tardus]MBO2989004.1 NADP-dependent oxidoreductase [Leucobacter tardus]
MSHTSQQWRLRSRPHGTPKREDFQWDEQPARAPDDGEVLLRTRYLSLDPYMRGRMSDAESYAEPVELGEVMVGATVSEVVESRSPDFEPGQTVLGYGGWQSFSTEPARSLRALDPDVAPVTTALGVLGMPGFTAYAGLRAIGAPQAGETVAVAAATGPVGSAVGQIAKLMGCRTVGIAGGSEKVAYLEQLGFDAALDHRSGDLSEQLRQAAPEGIDVYFENVGGPVLEAILPHLNTFARVPVCGLAATYNATEPPAGPDRAPALVGLILRKSLTLRGFIQTEFVPTMFEQFLTDMSDWVRDGKIQYREDITVGLDQAPEVFARMLDGGNFGKTIVEVAG